MIGRQVGDYRIVQELGEGGMGMVFKGEHAALGQIVAVKSLHANLMNNQAAKERFEREAVALARLNHPNIISLLNFINDDSGCYIVMEFAAGEDLEQKLQRMGLIPPQQCLPWFIGACRGLSYAHDQKIIHRDIKPSNIIVHPSGATKLLDFGTAKLVDAQRLTQQGMTLGTVIYMSKEQLLGKPLDARSDVYSLGVTLYECVTGQLPFYDEEERKLVVKIAKEDPTPPSEHYPGISKDLEAIILKGMAKDPSQRFQSAKEMEAALSALLGGRSTNPAMAVPQAPPSPAQPAPAPAPAAPPPATPASKSGGMFSSPLFYIGLFLVFLGIALGVLGAFSEGFKFIVGLIGSGVGCILLGFLLLMIAAIKSTKRGAQPAAAASPAAAAPAPVPPAAPPAAQPGHCPQCQRAMLPGMTDCPFCNPQAPPPMAMAPPPAPQVGTVPVNTAQAAQTLASPQAATPAGGALTLQVIDGNDKGTRLPLAPNGRLTIGRAATCSLPLNDPGVSGEHAAISFQGGQLMVHDLNSRNGVFVNNQRIQQQQPIRTGDYVIIGSTRMVVNA